jgi:hypothetical protein
MSAFGFADEIVAPSVVPTNSDALVSEPTLPHAGVTILHAINLPELHASSFVAAYQ